MPQPMLLYGTAWKEERTEELTALALRAGFRGIDTANQRKHYFEAGVGTAVGDAIERGEVTRADLFLQTKFTFRDGQDHRLPYEARAPITQQVVQSAESSLEHLRTDYLDSYVLHGPAQNRGIGAKDREAWAAMEGLHRQQIVRQLGVSNVSLGQLRELFEVASVKPSFVQNRCYAHAGWDREVRAFCREHAIVYQPFSLLTANRRELASAPVARIAERTGRSVPELVFRFAVALGMLPLTGTTNPEHMRLDLGILDFELEPAELRVLEDIGGVQLH